MNALERYVLMHGSPADERKYELTEEGIVLAFECATELECDFSCDIERMQKTSYLNDDAESLQALTAIKAWRKKIGVPSRSPSAQKSFPERKWIAPYTPEERASLELHSKLSSLMRGHRIEQQVAE